MNTLQFELTTDELLALKHSTPDLYQMIQAMSVTVKEPTPIEESTDYSDVDINKLKAAVDNDYVDIGDFIKPAKLREYAEANFTITQIFDPKYVSDFVAEQSKLSRGASLTTGEIAEKYTPDDLYTADELKYALARMDGRIHNPDEDTIFELFTCDEVAEAAKSLSIKALFEVNDITDNFRIDELYVPHDAKLAWDINEMFSEEDVETTWNVDDIFSTSDVESAWGIEDIYCNDEIAACALVRLSIEEIYGSEIITDSAQELGIGQVFTEEDAKSEWGIKDMFTASEIQSAADSIDN